MFSILWRRFSPLSGARNSRQSGEVQLCSGSTSSISGLCLSQGFSLPVDSREAAINWRRIPVLQATARFYLAGPSRCSLLPLSSSSRGSPQPSRASSGDRVVSPSSGGEITVSHVGQPVDRPFCDMPQRETAPVLLACPGSPGRLRGCVSPSLGRPGSLCVPSLCSGRSGDRPRTRVIAGSDDTGRTSLAREGVVCRLAASSDPTTPGSALLGQAASATPLQSVPSRRPRAEPSRVETLKRHYRKLGFSGRAARVMAGVLRESSLDCTSRDGRSSVVGVVEGALLQSTPLYQ